jgi:cytoskeletal protein CcmA (bactofilin family)
MAMFNKEGAARSEVRSAPGSEGALSIIASSVRIVGDLESPGVVKVDGQIEGSVTGARQLLLGRGGAIRGNVAADEVVIGGLVDGSIVALERLELQSTAVVNGDIETRSIVVLEGARINGSVRMTDLVANKAIKAPSLITNEHDQLRIATQ